MTNHPNRGKHHRVKIVLLGGYDATIGWTDNQDEGEILMDDAFLTYIHEHTRETAIATAASVAPHVLRWHCISNRS